LLPQQSSKAVRVCLDCYDSLSQSKNEQIKASTGNPKSNNNTTADSSGEDDSDDEEEQKEAHDEPKFYGDAEKN